MVKLVIPGVVPAAIPQYPEHVTAWKSPTDPPTSWYKMFSSMQYDIRQINLRPRAGERPSPDPWQYRLTPVVGRPVYTFDDWGDFIDAAREFSVRLFITDFPVGVAQYRCHIGPPRVHIVYRLPPMWTWSDDGDQSIHLR